MGTAGGTIVINYGHAEGLQKGRAALRVLENAAGNLRVELPIEFVNRASTGAPKVTTNQ